MLSKPVAHVLQLDPDPMELSLGHDNTQTRCRTCGGLHQCHQAAPRDAVLVSCACRGMHSISHHPFAEYLQLARRAGVPDGVINVVTTHKNVREVGKEMCESKIVKKVSFTGSTAVAKLLAGMSASTLKKLVFTFFPPRRD